MTHWTPGAFRFRLTQIFQYWQPKLADLSLQPSLQAPLKGFLMGTALSRASDLTCSDLGLSGFMQASLHQSTLLQAGHMLTKVNFPQEEQGSRGCAVPAECLL